MMRYCILGADGKEYGPINGEVMRQWITDGRANAQTKVKAEASPDWQLLASVPEFADVFAAASGAPPPLTATPVEVKTSGMAIASLSNSNTVCGSTSLSFLPSSFALNA